MTYIQAYFRHLSADNMPNYSDKMVPRKVEEGTNV